MTTPSVPGGPDPDPSPTQPVELPSSAPATPTPPGGAWAPPAGANAFQPAAPEDVPVPVVAPVRVETRRSSGGSRLLNLALGVAVLVAVAGVAFAIGRSTTPAQAASVGAAPFGNGGFQGGPNGSFDPNSRPFTNGEFPGGGAFGGGRGAVFGLGGGISVSGTVDTVSADSITIKTASGQTITVGLDGSTTYHQQAAATSADVQAGKTVILQLQPRNRQNGNGGGATGNNGNGNGNGGGGTGGAGNGQALGSASDVTIVP